MYQNNIYIDNYEELLSADDKRMLGLHDWVGDKEVTGRVEPPHLAYGGIHCKTPV